MTKLLPYRVAICQESIIQGGRFRVVLGLIEALNEIGIEPEILCFRLRIKPSEIEKVYGKKIQATFRELPRLPLPNDYSILLFNKLLSRFTKKNDLVINTSNSLISLPRHKKVISYVFFLRESRVNSSAVSIHNPDKPLNFFSLEGISRKILRIFYKNRKIWANHKIVAMTEFTKTALRAEYPVLDSLQTPVIYPPVEIRNFLDENKTRNRDIVTIGRFDEEKKQLEQIELARQIPDITFHIMGFVGDPQYFKRCEARVTELGLSNVHLYPNVPHAQMAEVLRKSKYFLHTLINEPFGITAVQAVAAGCIPIVHDSGGQREVIPYVELRYKTMSDIKSLLERLEEKDSMTIVKLHADLLKHVQANYDEDIFHEKIKSVLLAELA